MRLLAVLFLFLFFASAACGTDDSSEPILSGFGEPLDAEARERMVARLRSERDTWKSAALGTYSLTLEAWNAGRTDTLSFVVQDDRLVSAGERAAAWGLRPDGTPVIDQLFAVLADAIEEGDALRVEFQSDLGYPASVSIDWDASAFDDEVRYTVLELGR